MKMTFRWYGPESDHITLKQIRQIPGMSGLMGVLDYKAAGEVWTEGEIKPYMEQVHSAGLACEVIESVNVHEDIKMGLPTRDQYIDNYCQTIRNLAKFGVKVIVYNFMPVFDWLRTDLARAIPEDGSTSLYYDEAELGTMGPLEIVRSTIENANGFSLPGWEPARLAELETTLKRYESISTADMLANYQYFLKGITLGHPESAAGKLEAILSNPELFGTNLVEAGLYPKIEAMFRELLTGKGAVRKTLEDYLKTHT